MLLRPALEELRLKLQNRLFFRKLEKEKEAIISNYKMSRNNCQCGLRFAGPNIIVDVGKTEAVMPPHEQIQMKNII